MRSRGGVAANHRYAILEAIQTIQNDRGERRTVKLNIFIPTMMMMINIVYCYFYCRYLCHHHYYHNRPNKVITIKV